MKKVLAILAALVVVMISNAAFAQAPRGECSNLQFVIDLDAKCRADKEKNKEACEQVTALRSILCGKREQPKPAAYVPPTCGEGTTGKLEKGRCVCANLELNHPVRSAQLPNTIVCLAKHTVWDAVNELRSRIAKLEERADATDKQIEALWAEINKLKGRLDQQDAFNTFVLNQLQDVQKRLTSLEERVTKLERTVDNMSTVDLYGGLGFHVALRGSSPPDAYVAGNGLVLLTSDLGDGLGPFAYGTIGVGGSQRTDDALFNAGADLGLSVEVAKDVALLVGVGVGGYWRPVDLVDDKDGGAVGIGLGLQGHATFGVLGQVTDGVGLLAKLDAGGGVFSGWTQDDPNIAPDPYRNPGALVGLTLGVAFGGEVYSDEPESAEPDPDGYYEP